MFDDNDGPKHEEHDSSPREAGLDTKFMVGGAVLNEEYREFVGADLLRQRCFK